MVHVRLFFIKNEMRQGMCGVETQLPLPGE